MTEEQFPILSQGIYANHAAIAPWPRATAEAVAAFAMENGRTGPLGYRTWVARERELRELLARLIGAGSTRDIALLKNTAEGVSTVAFGFPWRDGDNLVLPKDEFPSNRLPWLSQRARGVEVREVEVRGTGEPEAALLAAMDERTRMLAVSSVSFNDGLRLDLEKLGEACEAGGVLFFVDAIQHLGALPFDVDACRVDCLAAGGHKWLLGPEGIALFYCRQETRARIGLSQAGWHMYDYPWDFERSDWTPSTSARRFEAGSPNSLGQAALHASLQLLLDEGIQEISARVLANTRKLIEGLSALPGVTIRSPVDAHRLSGIVSFSTGGIDDREVLKRLTKAGVTCALRGGAIRLSPHFYQDLAVMEKLLEHIEDAL